MKCFLGRQIESLLNKTEDSQIKNMPAKNKSPAYSTDFTNLQNDISSPRKY
jgi:hypothetical protein